MRALQNAALRMVTLVAAILAGCKFPVIAPLYGVPAYGVAPPDAPPDPELALLDLSYEPASPVELGQQVTFRVTANKTFNEHYLFVRIAENHNSFSWDLKHRLTAQLMDTGDAPDEVAGDGVFSGSLTLPSWMGAFENLPVIARVEWWSSAPAPEITGEPLTVVDSTEEQP